MNKKQNKKDISRIFLWDTIIDIKMPCQTWEPSKLASIQVIISRDPWLHFFRVNYPQYISHVFIYGYLEKGPYYITPKVYPLPL